MKQKLKILLGMLVVISFTACNNATEKTYGTTTSADAIYFGGDIITMEGETATYAEAVAVKDGKIVFVGSKAEAEKMKGDSTAMNDLAGKTLLPGFNDSHSHVTMAIQIIEQANVSSPPVGNCKTIDDIIKTLEQCKKDNGIKDGEWIFGWGYDEGQLKEKRHPNKMDLDKAFPNNPVYIAHVSGHMGVANSLALADGKIDKSTPNPEGGMILRLPGSKEPSGVLQETAIIHYTERTSEVFASKKAKLLQKALDLYAENGITTAQEGFTDAVTVKFLKDFTKENKLSIDVVSLTSFLDLKNNIVDSSLHYGTYKNGLKFAGTKTVADGSPQGKTAFFTKPFLTKVPGCANDCRGFSNVTQDQLNGLFEACYAARQQLFVHCNGDATMDMLLLAHENTCKKLNQPLDSDRRTVVIHSNFVRMDQLVKYKQYNIIPSLFTNHAFYWGDAHVENLGKDRAYFLSPIHSADSIGLIYTNHTDYIVTPLNQIFTIWSAVNRVSRFGNVIGPNERATPYQALKALTINGAYQHFDEKSKGTLTSGKLADLVILSENPIKIDPMKIKDIVVLETIKEGKTVFKKK